MIRLLTRFFDDIHRISEMLQNFDLHGISLSEQDRLLLSTPRRRKPKAKELA